MNLPKFCSLLAILSFPLLATTLGAEPMVLDIIKPSGFNKDGEYGFSSTGGVAELNLIGGSSINESWVMARGEPLLNSVVDFAKGEQLKIEVENIQFEGHGVPPADQILHITLSPQPNLLPYDVDQALSLELRANGAFRAGIRSAKGGWPSRVNGRSLGEGSLGIERNFSRLEIIVSREGFSLQAFGSDGQSPFSFRSAGPLPELNSWALCGINFVLQKVAAGPQTQLISSIGNVSVSKIDQP